MGQILRGLLYENGKPSLTRFIFAGSFIIFCLGTAVDIYLATKGINWPNYSTFAAITGGGSIGGKLADKITDTLKGRTFQA